MNVILGRRRQHFRTVGFDRAKNAVLLIEQRLLPHKFSIVATPDFRATARAIQDMVVRGAGAIGATAAYGFAQGLRSYRGTSRAAFRRHADLVFRTLAEARPTAIDPVNAMRGIQAALEQVSEASIPSLQEMALIAAESFADEDVQHCHDIGVHGLPLIREGMNILTHCNAGWLAFVDIGSATAPLYAAQAAGRKFHVFCDETRPRSQGASLTAWELAQQGIPHHIIADNAAGHLMQRGEIDLVIVGADRVLGRTGEVANKIGTYSKAVLARRHELPFYVAIPLSTLDWNLARGSDIPIEERSEDEVLGAWGLNPQGKRTQVRVANPTSPARNPAFDVTPAELITGILTPAGLFRPKELWRRRRQLGGPA
ncbi:MAG: S-methyl-5-thioribose-1-phosphate isomerase [Limisphaerales bacterium]